MTLVTDKNQFDLEFESRTERNAWVVALVQAAAQEDGRAVVPCNVEQQLSGAAGLDIAFELVDGKSESSAHRPSLLSPEGGERSPSTGAFAAHTCQQQQREHNSDTQPTDEAGERSATWDSRSPSWLRDGGRVKQRSDETNTSPEDAFSERALREWEAEVRRAGHVCPRTERCVFRSERRTTGRRGSWAWRRLPPSRRSCRRRRPRRKDPITAGR